MDVAGGHATQLDGVATPPGSALDGVFGCPDTKEFLLWCKKRGVVLHPDIALPVPIPRMGFGVVAKRNIHKGDTLISVPHACYISPADADIPNAPAAAVISAHRPPLPDWMRTVLRLMAEASRGRDSPFAPWLRCCPLLANHFFDLTQQQRELLFTTSTCNLAETLADINVDAAWQLAQPLVAANPSVWCPPLADSHTFAQCCAQVFSRNFFLEGRQRDGPHLVPGADFMNHSHVHANVEFVSHGGGGRKHVTFDVMASKDIARGQQIFFDYGDLPNCRLFAEFGFTIANNPVDGVRMSVETLTKLCAHDGVAAVEIVERISHLQRAGILPREGLSILSGVGEGDAVVDPAFLNVIHALTVPKAEYSLLTATLTRWWVAELTPQLLQNAIDVLRRRAAMAPSPQSLKSVFADRDASCIEIMLSLVAEEGTRISRAIALLESKLRAYAP